MFAKFEELENRFLRGRPNLLKVSRSGLWLRQRDETGFSVIFANSVNPAEIALNDVIIFLYDEVDAYHGRIDAKSATLEPGYWDVREARVTLGDTVGEPLSVYRLKTDLTPEKIQESFASPETLSFWDLPAFIRTLGIDRVLGAQPPHVLSEASCAAIAPGLYGPVRGGLLSAPDPARRDRDHDPCRHPDRLHPVYPQRRGNRAWIDRGGPGGMLAAWSPACIALLIGTGTLACTWRTADRARHSNGRTWHHPSMLAGTRVLCPAIAAISERYRSHFEPIMKRRAVYRCLTAVIAAALLTDPWNRPGRSSSSSASPPS